MSDLKGCASQPSQLTLTLCTPIGHVTTQRIYYCAMLGQKIVLSEQVLLLSIYLGSDLIFGNFASAKEVATHSGLVFRFTSAARVLPLTMTLKQHAFRGFRHKIAMLHSQNWFEFEGKH